MDLGGTLISDILSLSVPPIVAQQPVITSSRFLEQICLSLRGYKHTVKVNISLDCVMLSVWAGVMLPSFILSLQNKPLMHCKYQCKHDFFMLKRSLQLDL